MQHFDFMPERYNCTKLHHSGDGPENMKVRIKRKKRNATVNI